MNKIYIFLITIIIFSSCKTVRVVSKDKPIRENKTELFDTTKSKYLNFNTFSAKITTKLDLPKQKNTVNATLRIKKDSCIWVSITPLMGIEMFRVIITKDSLKYLNKTNATYFAGDYKYIESALNLKLNYNIIQSILMNELFKYENDYNTNIDIRDFYFEKDTNTNCLQNISREELKAIEKSSQPKNYLFQKFFINPKTQKILRAEVDEKILNRELNVHYSDFQQLANTLFPNEVSIRIKNDKENAEISIKYAKITLDNVLTYPFNISDKYKKIEQ